MTTKPFYQLWCRCSYICWGNQCFKRDSVTGWGDEPEIGASDLSTYTTHSHHRTPLAALGTYCIKLILHKY